MNDMKINDLSFQELMEFLDNGKMLTHPGVEQFLYRDIDTGDEVGLRTFLLNNPVILAKARHNIKVAAYQQINNPFRPYPSQKDVAKYMNGPLKIGYVNEHDGQLGIEPDDLCKIMLNMGRVGSGKSFFVKYLLHQASKLPNRNFNLIVCDPQKREYRGLIESCPTLQIIPPEKLKLNPFVIHPFLDQRQHIILLTDVLVSEAYLGATSRNFIIWLLKELYREVKNPNLHTLLRGVQSIRAKTKTYRMYDIYLAIENRLQAMLESEIFSCSQGIPLEVFQRRDVVLELDGHQDMVANFIIAFITRSLYLANVRQGLTDGKLRHLLVLEEARNLLQANRNVSDYGESAFNQDLTRIRAAGIGVVITTQEPKSISPTAHSLAFFKIAFPMNDGNDLDILQASQGLTDEQRAYMFEIDPCGIAIIRIAPYPKPLLLAIPHFPLEGYVDDGELISLQEEFQRELDSFIGEDTVCPDANDTTPINLSPSATHLAYVLGKNPFTRRSELMEVGRFTSAAEAERALDELVRNKLVSLEPYRTRGTKPAVYLVLTENALQFLNDPGPPGHGSYEHKLFQHLVAKWCTEAGMQTFIEGHTRGSTKAIDVLARSQGGRQTAYEITRNFGNLIDNITQDLQAGVDEVVVVTRGLKEQQEAINLVTQTTTLGADIEKVSFKTINEFSTDPA